MTKADIIKQHPVVKLNENSGTVDGGGQPKNFVVTADKESITNYSRSGNDLVIQFSDKKTLHIKHFFASGKPICNLIFNDDGSTWLTNFNDALTKNGDGILDTNVFYEEIKGQSGFSSAVLLGILGSAAGIGGGIAAANSSDDDDDEEPVIDRTPPAAPQYSVINNNDPKNLLVVKNGGSLNDKTPLLSGKGVAGNTITISLDGYPTMTTKVNADGTWKFELPALKDGNYNIKVTQTDANGNVSEQSIYKFTVDTKAPDAPEVLHGVDNVSPDPIGSTGELKDGDFTNDKTPTLTGKGEPGSTVKIYDTDDKGQKTLVGSGVVDKDGNWSVEVNKALGDGHHKLTTTLTDVAGNESAGTDFNVNIDSTIPAEIKNFRVEDNYPEITGALPLTGGVTDDETPVFKGEVGKDVTQIIIKLNGHEFIIDRNTVNEAGLTKEAGEKVIHDDGTFAFRLPQAYKLEKGNYNYEVYAQNRVGNESSHINGNFAFDRTIPPAIGVENLDVIDNAGAITGSYKNWAERGTDHAKVTDDNHAVFKGSVPAGYDVSKISHINIYDGDKKVGEATVKADGTWEYTQEWSKGHHSLSAAVVNKTGTIGHQSNPNDFSFDVDTDTSSAPTIAEVIDGKGAQHIDGHSTNSNSFVLKGNGPASGKVTVKLYDKDGHQVVDAAGHPLEWASDVSASGSWSVNTGDLSHLNPPLKEEKYTFKADAVDAKGTATEPSNAHGLERDTVAPNTPEIHDGLDNVSPDPVGKDGTLHDGDYTNDTTPTLNGKGEPGGIVTIYDTDQNGNKTVVGKGKVDDNGNWSVETSTPLSPGAHKLVSTVTDAAGNESTGAEFNVNIDTSKPVSIEDFRVEDNNPEVTGALPLHDGKTDDETPIFKGRISADATHLIIKLNGHEFVIDRNTVNEGSNGEKVIHDDGTFAFRLPEAYKLTNGHYTVETYVKNKVGNESDHINGDFTFEHIVPPSVGTEGLDVIDNVGAIQGSYKDWAVRDSDHKKVTDDNRAIFKGRVPTNYDINNVDHINIYDGDKKIGEATVKANGTWEYSQEWMQGEHHLGAAIVNKFGTVGPKSNPDDFNFWVDLNRAGPPSIQQVKDENGNFHETGYPTNSKSFFFTGDGPVNGTVTLKLYDKDGNEVKNFKGEPLQWTAKVSSTGSWTVDTGDLSHLNPPLVDGKYQFEADAVDSKGTATNRSGPHVIDRDTIAPDTPDAPVATDNVGDVQGPIASNSTTDDDTPTLSGTGKRGEVVKIYDNNGDTPIGQTVVGENGTWTWTPVQPLKGGNHALQTTLTDAAGNESGKSAPVKMTIDTSSVEIFVDGAHDDVGSVREDVHNHGVTDDRTPTLFGRGTAGQSVVIKDETGTVVGTTTVDQDGNWKVQLTNQAQDNQEITHTYKATITNAAGNQVSVDFTLTIDTKAPDVPQIGGVIDNVNNQGGNGDKTLHSGDTTDDTTPTFTGVGTPGDTIKLYDGTKVVGESVVKNDGTWSVTPKSPITDLDAKHHFSVTETDPAGNESGHSSEFELDFDTKPVPGIGGKDEIDLIDDAGSIVGSYRDGQWATRLGQHGETVIITDDKTPTLKGQLPQDVLASGRINSINVYDNGVLLAKVAVTTNGKWEYTPTLTAGNNHNFEVAYENKAGVEGPRTSFPFVLDLATVGQTSIDSATTGNDKSYTWGSPTNQNVFHLQGSAPKNSKVTVYLKDEHGNVIHTFTTTDSDAAGSWSQTVDLSTVSPSAGAALADGRYSFVADARNDAGAVGAPSGDCWVNRDITPPTTPGKLTATDSAGDVHGNIEEGKTYDDDLPRLSGRGEANCVVNIYDNNHYIGSTKTLNDGTWSWTPDTPLTGGSHSLYYTLTDVAGNVSQQSSPLGFNLDLTPPEVKIDNAIDDYNKAPKNIGSGGATNDPTPKLVGRGTAGQTVTILDNTTGESWTVTVDQNGNWELQLPSQQGVGEDKVHEYIASLVNAAGNRVENRFNLRIDTAAPQTPTIVEVIDNVGNDPAVYPDGNVRLQHGSVTDDTTPTFNGTGTAGDIIKLYALDAAGNNKVIGQTTVRTDGTWSVTPTVALTDDAAHSPTKYTFTLTETDAVGNESRPTNGYDLFIDRTPPVIDDASIKLVDDKEALTGNYPTWPDKDDGVGGKIKLTNDDTPTMSGRAISGDTKSVNIYDRDLTTGNFKLIGTVDVDKNGDWKFTPKLDNSGRGLADGVHEWIARPVDLAGNEGQPTPSYKFVVDTGKPGGTLGSEVGLWDNEGKEQGEFSGAGGTTAWNTNDQGHKVTDDKTPEVKGKLPAGSDVTKVHIYVDGELASIVSVGTDGTWSYTPTLSSGAHKIEARPANDAGNEKAGQIWNFDVAGAAPGMPAITGIYNNNSDQVSDAHPDGKFIDKDQFTNDVTPLIKGTGDAGSFVNIWIGNTLVASKVRVGADGRWSVAIDPLSKGVSANGESWKIQASASDAAGQESEKTGEWPINVDTIRPVTPALPKLEDHVGDKTGDVEKNSTIDDRSPTISGKAAEGGVLVTISDTVNGVTKVITQIYAGKDGNWSYTPSNLSNGAHSITTTYTDAAGNVSETSEAFGFSIDTSNVLVSILHAKDNQGHDTSDIANNGITDDNTPELVGTTSPNTRVTIKEGNNVIGSVDSDEHGNWSYQLPEQGNGKHTYTASVIAPNGNESHSYFNINIDSTPPSAPAIDRVEDDVQLNTNDLQSGSKTNDTKPTFYGHGTAGDQITIYDDVNGTLVNIGTARVNDDGKWVITVDELAQGTHHFKLQTTNKLGADSAQMTDYELTVKTDAPTQNVTLAGITQDLGFSDHDFITSDNTLVFKLAVSEKLPAGYKVQVNVDGTWHDATLADDGYWYYDHSNTVLADNTYKIYGRIVDDAGNTKEGPKQDVLIDTSKPQPGEYAISIDSFVDNVNEVGGSKNRASGEATDDNTPTLNGHTSGMKAGDYVTVQTKINGDWVTIGKTTVDSSGNWKFDVTGIPGGSAKDHLDDGYHEFRAIVTDQAGNLGVTSNNFGLNVQTSTPPNINESNLVLWDDQEPGIGEIGREKTTNDSRPTLKGAAGSVDPNKVATINLYDDDKLVGTAKVNSDGSWSVESELPLKQGAHNFVAKPVDHAGNIGHGTTAWNFVFQGEAPATPSIGSVLDDNNEVIQKDHVTQDSTPLIKGTGTAGSTVHIYVDGVDVGQVAVRDDGTWQFPVPALANPASDPNGTKHIITAKAVDKDGVWSHETGGYPIVVDRQAPDAPGKAVATDDAGNTITGTTADSTPTLSGKVANHQPGDKVNIYSIDDRGHPTKVGEVLVGNDGSWSWTQKEALKDGDHKYTTSVSDAAGNESAVGPETAVHVDTSGGKVTIDYLKDDQAPIETLISRGGATNDTTPEIWGKAAPGKQVVLKYKDAKGVVHDLANVTADENGYWHYQVTNSNKFVEGHYTLTAQSTDVAGNSTSSEFGFDVDLTNYVVPIIDSILDDVGTIQTDVERGGKTDDTTPTLVGQGAEPFGKVNIYDNYLGSRAGVPQLIGSVYADKDGKWSFTTLSPLGEGTHLFTAKSVDGVGNESGPSAEYNIVVDVTPPSPIANDTIAILDNVSKSVGDFTGALADKQHTNDNRPEFTGRAPEDTKTVNIYDQGKLIGSAIVKTDGTWSFTPPENKPLQDGTHIWTARPVDGAGNEGTDCKATEFVVDTVAPTATTSIVRIESDTGTSDSDFITQEQTPTIFVKVSGTIASDEHVEISLDGGKTWVIASYNASKQEYSYSVAKGHELGGADYDVRARVVDSAGNAGPEAQRTMTIDRTPPVDGYTVTIDSFYDDVPNGVGDYHSGASTNDSTPLLKGTVRGAIDSDVIHLYYRDTNGVLHSVADNIHLTKNADGSYSWQYQLPELTEGKYQYVAVVKDAAGNEGATTNGFYLTVDLTPPVWENITNIKLMDDQQPVTGEIAHINGVTDDNYPEVQAGPGTVKGAEGGVVELFDGKTKIGEGIIQSDGSFKIIPDKGINPGHHNFHLVAIDAAGNRTPLNDVSWDFNFAGQAAPDTPSITNIIDDYRNPGDQLIYLQKGQSTNDATPTLRGTGAVGTRIHIYMNGKEINTDANPVIVGSDGSWSFTIPDASALRDTSTNGLGTTYNFYVQAVDNAGTTSVPTGVYPIVYDNTAPSKPNAPTLISDQEPGAGEIVNGTTNDVTPTLTGKVVQPQPNDKVTIYENINGNFVKIGETEVKADGSWSWTPTAPLSNGSHEFATSVTDAAGNESIKSNSVDVNVDPTSALVTILYAEDNVKENIGNIAAGAVTNDTTPDLHGRASANASVKIYAEVNGVRKYIGTTNVDSDGNWTFVWPQNQSLSDQSYKLVAVATALNGTTAEDKFDITIDTTNNNIPTIDSISDDVGVIQSTVQSGGSSDDTTPTLSGHGAEPNGRVNIFNTDADGRTRLVDTVRADADGKWVYSVQSPLSEGHHHFTATSVDAAGNESRPSAVYDYNIDLTPPEALTSVTLIDDVPEDVGIINGVTNDNQPTYSGLASADTKKVFIYDQGKKIAEVNVVEENGQYKWTYTPDVALIDGPHAFQARPVDAVGNIGTPTDVWNFTVATSDITTTTKIDSITKDTGFADNDFITSDTRPTIYVKVSQPLNVANGEKVQVNLQGHWYDTTYDPSTGKYFFQPDAPLPASAQGTDYVIKTRIIDNAGRASGFDERTMTIDDSAPTGTVTLDKFVDNVGVEGEFGRDTEPNYTDDRTPELKGTVSGASASDYVVVYLADKNGNIIKDANGVPVKLGSVHPNGTNWSITPTLDEARFADNTEYHFVAVLEDAAGNQGAISQPLGLWLATQGPVWTGSNSFKVYDDVAPEVGFIGENGNPRTTDDNRPTVMGQAGSLDPSKASYVLLYDGDPANKNAKPIGKGYVKADGSWSVEPDTPLQPGAHHFYVVPVSKAGVPGRTPSDVFDFNVIGSAPGTPAITQVADNTDPSVVFPDNQIQPNQTTRDKTPVVGGTGAAGSIINVYENVNGVEKLLVDGVVVGTNGRWSCELPELNDGVHKIYARAHDAAGNVSQNTGLYPVEIDTTPPTNPARPTITSDVDPTIGEISGSGTEKATTNDTTPTFSGKIVDPKPGDVVTIYDGSKAIGQAKVQSDGKWSFTPKEPLKEGDHNFTTTVTDAAGNVSGHSFGTTVAIENTQNNVTIDYAVDDVAPVTGRVTSGGRTDDRTPELHGTAPAGSTVIVYADASKSQKIGGPFNVGSDGKWSLPLSTQTTGEHNYYVEATNRDGSVLGHQSFKLIIDDSSVSVPVINSVTDDVGLIQGKVEKNKTTDDTNPTISGTAPKDSLVIIYDNDKELGRVYADSEGKWSYTTAAMLPEGTHKFTAVAQNDVGTLSASSVEYTVTVDVTAPNQITDQKVQDNVLPNNVNGEDGEAIVTINQNGVTNDNSPIFSGSAPTDAVKVRIYDGNKFITEVDVDANHKWSWEAGNGNTDALLAEGNHSLTARPVDAAGNEGQASVAQSFVVDTHVPTATVVLESITDDTGFSNVDFNTQDRTPLFTFRVSGTVKPGDKVQAYVNGDWRDLTYNDKNGKWELDWRNGPEIPDGSYTVKTRVISPAGVYDHAQSDASATQIVIDGDGSSQHSVFTGFTNNLGAQFQSGDYVNVTNPTLTGKLSGKLAELEEGSKIGIYRDHVLLGYIEKSDIKADGTFTFKLPDNSLQDGHRYTFTTAIVSKSGYVGDVHSEVEVRVNTTGSAHVPDYGHADRYSDNTITQAIALTSNGEWQITDSSNVWVFSNNSNGKADKHFLDYFPAGDLVGSNQWEPFYFGSMTLADYNHDGFVDVWTTKTKYLGDLSHVYAGTSDTQWNYVGVKYADMVNGRTNVANDFGGIATLDMNGDGYLDVIQGDSGNASAPMFLNKGTSTSTLSGSNFIGMGQGFNNQSDLMSKFYSGHEISAIDLDNNGTIDFAGNAILQGTSDNWYNMLTLLNSGNTAPVNGQYGHNWSLGQVFENVMPKPGSDLDYRNTVSMTWADYNGDGYMDLFLARGYNNSTDSQIFYNTGDGSGKLQTTSQKLSDSTLNQWSVAVDWDGDGYMDVIEVPWGGGNGSQLKLWHNATKTSGRDLDGHARWSEGDEWNVFGAKGGRLVDGNGDVDPSSTGGLFGAAVLDTDWDGALDVAIQTNAERSSLILKNKNKIAYGTSLHFRITDRDGANVFYNNTVQLFDSKGMLVASQVINAQGGIGASDNTGLVHFYGLKADETYSVAVLRNTNGDANHIGGEATLGGKTIQNVNSSWTGLKAVEADHAYILNANKDGETVTTGVGDPNDASTQGYRPGLVGTGYNDLFTAEAGSQSYSGGGGWHTDATGKYWQASGGEDIVDFGKATVGVNVDLSKSGYQSTGFNNALFKDIEGIYGSKYADTLTGNAGDNIFDGRGGNDTYHLENGGHDLLLFKLIQGADAKDGTGGNGHDTVYGFHVGIYDNVDKTKIDADADRIDVKELLQGYHADADGPAHFDNNGKAQIDWGNNIKDFLSTRVENGNTILSVDRDGKGSAFQSSDLLTLNNVNTDLETLLANHQIIVG